MTDRNRDHSNAVQAAAESRLELAEAVSGVERAAASPAAAESWRGRLLDELEKLRTALLNHIDQVEAEGGLLNEMLVQAPRLANQIESVRNEHPDLCRRVDQTILDIRDAEARDAEARDDGNVIDLRSDVLEIVMAISRHRQRGADLVYDGYNIDIGGS